MSAQGAPVLSRQNIPFKTRRSSTRGLPRTLVGRSGSITDHSKSVKSKRAITASKSMETVNHKPFKPKTILWVCDLEHNPTGVKRGSIRLCLKYKRLERRSASFRSKRALIGPHDI